MLLPCWVEVNPMLDNGGQLTALFCCMKYVVRCQCFYGCMITVAAACEPVLLLYFVCSSIGCIRE